MQLKSGAIGYSIVVTYDLFEKSRLTLCQTNIRLSKSAGPCLLR